jgi:hypothetical protein
MDRLHEWLAHAIAESESYPDSDYLRGYARCLRDVAMEFFPDDKDLWA